MTTTWPAYADELHAETEVLHEGRFKRISHVRSTDTAVEVTFEDDTSRTWPRTREVTCRAM